MAWLALYLYIVGSWLSMKDILHKHPAKVNQALIGSLFWPILVPIAFFRP